MLKVLLVQLPIPRLNFGQVTGNIPLGAACLFEAAAGLAGVQVEIVPESVASYLGDGALEELVSRKNPDILGFTAFSWNLDRSLHLAAAAKRAFSPAVVFGGPEITPDNARARSGSVDFAVFGEGEALFRSLLIDPGAWQAKAGAQGAAPLFKKAPSPYLRGLLEPEIEDLVLVETQRGCPYRCAFCYYSKSRGRPCVKGKDLLFPVFKWAVERGIGEVFLLDPSLNARPRLPAFLNGIAAVNPDRSTAFFSEIRAEAVDDNLADAFVKAGFTGFEVGLQSVNPQALARVNRPTDLDRFLKGAGALLKRGITLSIDLIAGLPGDDLEGFSRSVDFVASHGLGADVQVFPLSVLPGTDLRRDAERLGLSFESDPPYSVLGTPSFSGKDLLLAYDLAETRLDTVFFPMPDLDIAFRGPGGRAENPGDVEAVIGDGRYVAKVSLFSRRPPAELRGLARRLTQPYQVLAGPEAGDPAYLGEALETLTSQNPFVPLEVVFFDPDAPPDTGALLKSIRLRRPHFLDGDLRYLYPEAGNRAALFTVVSGERALFFKGPMRRQVFWWREGRLPEEKDLDALQHLDGVFIDAPVPRDAVLAWQNGQKDRAGQDHCIGFSSLALQRRWLGLVSPGTYADPALDALR